MTPSAHASATHNVPVMLTSFVGRHEELDRLLVLLGSHRLVTLTGVGGCGKTRLAVRAAQRLAEAGSDGPWFVSLSAVREPREVVQAVAGTLDILVEPGADPLSGLARQLAGRELLLVLDTCEHVVEAMAELAGRLLRSCPRLRVLATSREPLGVEGETVWQVPVLPVVEARRLFADRARLVASRLELTHAEADVDVVCAKVDHLPLGIELAAAWSRALSPAQIAAGLEDSIRLLAGGPRDAVPRHQTLSASIQWSHALLDPQERVLFRRLSAFAGTFDIAAVSQVAGDPDSEGGLGVPPEPAADPAADWAADWVRPLGRLLDKSLITAQGVAGSVRYRLLDTIRHFAEQELRTCGEEDAVLARHLAYYRRVAEDGEPGLDRDQDAVRAQLDGHHDNLVKAMRWGFAGTSEERAVACRLAAALGRYWFLRGLSSEGLRFLDLALATVDDPAVRHRLLAAQAALAMVSGRPDLLDHAVDEVLADPDADPVSRARCLTIRCFPAFFRDFGECQAAAREAHQAALRAEDPFARDWSLVMEGYSLQTRNLHENARAAAQQAFEGSMPRGDRFCAAFARGIEMYTSLWTGDVRAAVAIGEEGVAIARPLRDYFAVGTNTVNAAQAIGLSGDLERARGLIDPVMRSLDETEDADVVGFMVADGLLHLWTGDLEAAVRALERGVRRDESGMVEWTGLRCLPGLVGALRRLSRWETAIARAEEGIEAAQRYQTPYELAALLDELARLTVPTDRRRARDLLHRSLAVRREHGLLTCVPDSLEALAELDADQEAQAARATSLLAACETARDRMGYPRPPVDAAAHDRLLDDLRARFGEQFDQHWSAGSALALDDAVALAQRGRGSRDHPDLGWRSLSPTERQVAELVCAGLANPAVAQRLFMSRSTVKHHLSRVYQKLGVTNRTELAALVSQSSDPS